MLCSICQETQRRKATKSSKSFMLTELVDCPTKTPLSIILPSPHPHFTPQIKSLINLEVCLFLSKVNMVSYAVGLLCLMVFAAQGAAEAYQFTVGGQSGWSVPSSDGSSNPFNQWAERMRFLIGDSLVFVYQANQDSVLYVSKEAYDSCNCESYISKFDDGHTIFKLNQSGPFHFISGVKDRCLKNEKMVLVVLADRTNKGTSSPPTPPSSAPPSGEESPSPPAAGSVEINPSPAPASETIPPPPPPPRNSGPPSALIGFTSLLAAFAASSALLAL
ncbi:hypothetical protein SAY86_029726 [Trapa natans]|uniref:Phytocyanin domain-containing protein n=1 Tax=Trapa natans TaxID=22666 RepID=A0AAN7M1Q7_TRANT|nr:hypothetical protein SAY86_029726 [Trapa natans]